MPRVKTTTFKHTNSAGEALEFKSDISVDSDGVFSATVPDDVASAFRTLSLHGPEVWTTCPRQNWRVTGRDLEKVMRAVNAGMEELLAVETTVESANALAYPPVASAPAHRGLLRADPAGRLPTVNRSRKRWIV